MPLPVTLRTPQFLWINARELQVLYSILRHPLAASLYMLIVIHSDFESGEFLGNYARLIELLTPPQPERGRRRPAPSLKTVRVALDDLIDCGLVRRGLKNLEQGQLRLKVTPRKFPKNPI
jgi:hypothetical protein